MSSKLLLQYISDIFNTVFQKNEPVHVKYRPSILFLIEKDRQVRAKTEVGLVSSNMMDYFHHFITNGEGNCKPFEITTVHISLKGELGVWTGLFGIVTDEREHNINELEAFLTGLKHSISLAWEFIKNEQKVEEISLENNIHVRITKMLRESNYTEDAVLFANTLVDVLREDIVNGDVTVFIKDQLRSSFNPITSTSSIIVSNKKEYIIDENKVNDLMESVNNSRLTIYRKQEITRPLLYNQPKYSDYMMIPIYRGKDTIGLVIYTSEIGYINVQSIEEIIGLMGFLGPWISKILNYEEMQIEKVRKNLLLKVNRKFYSTMDVNSILEEILLSLHEAYPTFEVNLLLSHDWKVAEYLPVQSLEIADSEEDPGSKAYLTGEIQVVDNLEAHKTILYVPLKGKQGVYGILKMITASSQIFLQSELDFIQILATTGGNAIENAELYQQSRQYIQDLQVINQTSHKLNANLKLEEAIALMISQMKEACLADEVGFIMLDDRWSQDNKSMNWSGTFFQDKTRDQFIHELLVRMKERKEEIFLGDWTKESVPFKSVIGVPMVHNERVIGAVLVFGKDSYAFSFDKFKLCKSLVHHSSLALVNAILHEEMKQLVITDYLTKLFTREYMDEKVSESMALDGYGSFVLLDIDHFKNVNDQYGHQTGDHVLIQVAEIIRNNTKQKTDIPVRWGGEELAIYLPRTDSKDALKVAERIRENVEKSTNPHVSVSCGVSSWSHLKSVPTLTKLFADADKAMYSAKNSGRNKVVIYEELNKISSK
ncbi:sensor domain-containing diguanylate cyclase [Salipaludibacillus daqingensis]|uniref:sensor domain-containing diguanylate cyclase n=1 Tax=Salipaludibacillus daqingensis TaxID=3041001 RepID=UPI0024750104|nr:diguanylate cyclase [Salipaludibacillus daqingensis]